MKDGFTDSIDDHRSEYNWNLSNYKLLALKDLVSYKLKKKKRSFLYYIILCFY